VKQVDVILLTFKIKRCYIMKKTISNLLILILILSITACDSKTKSSSNDVKQITVAQWGQEKYLIYLPLYVAMEKGYFKKYGLDVKLKFSGNDDQVFATVIKGDAQFGIGDPVFAAISQEKGFPARVIGTLVNGVAVWGVTNNKEIKVIEKASDLEGLKIGTFPEPSTNYTLMKELITKHGLKNTKIVQAPIGSQLALLENGDADIVMELEPSTSISESKGYKVVYSSPEFYGKFAFTGITTTKDYLDGNKEVTKAFLKALEESLVDSHKDPSIAMSVAMTIFPKLDKNVIENAVNRMLNEKTYPEHIRVDDEAWKNAIDVRVLVGDIKDVSKVSDVVNNTFSK
jgi:NitT/TauT family transport system substrate-binding protein